MITSEKSEKALSDLVKELPPDLQEEVRDFVNFLMQKQKREQSQNLRQNWAGALREYRQRFTSLELQKASLNWREN